MHYTPVFLEAMENVKRNADSIGVQQAFYNEMKRIGWRERVKNLYRIKDKESGKFVFFQPNGGQEAFQEGKKNRNIILKCRQIGFTTWACIYAYDRAKWDGWSTGIMSHKREKTGLLFKVVRNANDWFKKDWGSFYTDMQSHDSDNCIGWEDTKATITVSYDFRGLTCQFLHVSEAAFIEAERLIGSLQAVPETGEAVLESTANGCGGFFYDSWQLHKNEGDSAPYRGFFFPWFVHYPENKVMFENIELHLTQKERELIETHELENYHIAWRRWKIRESCNNDEAKFEEEYPTDDVSCFLGGQSQVFPMEALKLQERFVKDAAFIGRIDSQNGKACFFKDEKGSVQIWDLCKPEKVYVIGVDVAEGTYKDYSVAIVLDRDTGEQVAMLRSDRIPLDELPDELYKLGVYYNRAWMCIEVNNAGSGVILDMIRKGYNKLYKRREDLDGNAGSQKKYGFRTTRNTKPAMIKDLVAACREGKVRIRSRVILEELSTFIQVSGLKGNFSYEAKQGCKDDCVMSLGLSWVMYLDSGNYIERNTISIPDNLTFDSDTGFLVPREDYGEYSYA